MAERLDPEEHARRVRLFGAFTRWLPWTVLALILAGLASVSLMPHDDTGPAPAETAVQGEAQAQPSPSLGIEGKADR